MWLSWRRPCRSTSAVLLAGVVLALACLAPAAEAAQEGAPASPSASSSTSPDEAATSEVGDLGPNQAPLADPYRPQQWHLDRVGITGDRPVPTGAGQVVAVLDSGIDLAHPDLVDALLRDDDGRIVGRDLVDGDDEPEDVFGHGTMVAGLVAATAGNGLGVAGVAPGARLMPVRVLDEQGEGTAAVVAAGIDWAVTHGADVVNLSLEPATTIDVPADPELLAAVARAVEAGVVVVSAAGNSDDPFTGHPVEAGVVVVGATDDDDRRAGFSDRGRLDLLMAPGTDIVSTWCRTVETPTCDGETHTYGIADGTSFAAPQVSGLVAMLMQVGLSGPEAVTRLAETARDLAEPGPDAETGLGLVDVAAALGPWPDGPVPAPNLAPVPAVVPSEEPPSAVPQPIAEVESPDQQGRVVMAAVLVAIGLAVLLIGRGLGSGRGSDT